MKRIVKNFIIFLVCFLAAILSIYFVWVSDTPVLDPQGVIAAREKELLVTASLLMIIVFIPVAFFTIFFPYWYRSGKNKELYQPDWEHNALAECLWWGVPFLVVFILSIIGWRSTHDLDPFKPLASNKAAVEIQVVALRWKWLFIYPKEGIATVNEMYLPEKTPINLTLTGDAPMNSFWIPRLAGQIYAMSGMRSKLHLMANQEGEFRGRAAHINGKGFAGMTFQVRATSERGFENWVKTVKNNGSGLDFARYKKLAQPSEYDPVQYFTVRNNLFEEILNQYHSPELK